MVGYLRARRHESRPTVPHLPSQLYTGDASTDAGKLRVLALVKAVVASFKGA